MHVHALMELFQAIVPGKLPHAQTGWTMVHLLSLFNDEATQNLTKDTNPWH